MRADLVVERRLRERRLVRLVVPVTPVADEIDQEILAEFRAVLDAKSRNSRAQVGVLGVDVHDRNLESLGQIARVACRASVARIGCEAHLIVRDDVQRAADAITAQSRKIERLGNHALAREMRRLRECRSATRRTRFLSRHRVRPDERERRPEEPD